MVFCLAKTICISLLNLYCLLMKKYLAEMLLKKTVKCCLGTNTHLYQEEITTLLGPSCLHFPAEFGLSFGEKVFESRSADIIHILRMHVEARGKISSGGLKERSGEKNMQRGLR